MLNALLVSCFLLLPISASAQDVRPNNTEPTGIFGTFRKPSGSIDYPVNIQTFGPTPKVIEAQKRTWIVIHGWRSSPASDSISAVADSLSTARSHEQVLTLDWSSAANTGLFDPFSAEDAIVPVAEWAADALVTYGFAGTNLNFVGHSFGSYVAAEIAERIPGGVSSIVALDPAFNVAGGYDSTADGELNFARDASFSWAFHSSPLGSDIPPVTANEAFIVSSGIDAISAHSAVAFLFAYMVLNPDDPVANLFLLNSLLTGNSGPWIPNQYSSPFDGTAGVQGYEAVITSTNGGTTPLNIDFVPRPALLISRTPDALLIAWSTNYPTFRLETSPTLGASANWTPLSQPPTIVGASNSVTLNANQVGFFRLAQP